MYFAIARARHQATRFQTLQIQFRQYCALTQDNYDEERIRCGLLGDDLVWMDYGQESLPLITFRIKTLSFFIKGRLRLDQEEAAKFFAANFSLSRGYPRLETLLGGNYMCMVMCDRSRSGSAWSSLPPAYPIYYATDNNLQIVSTRPNLTSVLFERARGGSRALSDSYVGDYLTLGYPIETASPFERVSAVPFGSTLVLDQDFGAHVSTYYPVGSSAYNWDAPIEETAKSATALLLESSTIRHAKPIEVFLSGGVDSRLLLAAIKTTNPLVYATTFGAEAATGEAAVAAKLANAAEVPHSVLPNRLQPGFAEPAMTSAIWKAGGLVNREAHAIIRGIETAVDEPHLLTFGNWPLYKGGLMQRPTKTMDDIDALLVHQLDTRLASADLLEPRKHALRMWRKRRTPAIPREILYLFSLEFRSWRWLAPKILHVSADHDVFYPFLDEKFVDYCSTINPLDRISHRLAYRMLRKLAPRLADIKLYNKQWRFDQSARTTESSNSYVTPAAHHEPRPMLTAKKPGSSDIKVIHQYINDIFMAPPYGDMLNPDYVSRWVNITEQKFLAQFTKEHINLWRLFALSVFLSRSWEKL